MNVTKQNFFMVVALLSCGVMGSHVEKLVLVRIKEQIKGENRDRAELYLRNSDTGKVWGAWMLAGDFSGATIGSAINSDQVTSGGGHVKESLRKNPDFNKIDRIVDITAHNKNFDFMTFEDAIRKTVAKDMSLTLKVTERSTENPEQR